MIPERYNRLLEWANKKNRSERPPFIAALHRTEASRLKAERHLRERLAHLWSGELDEVKSLRPLDLLDYFEEYAQRIFGAAGTECVGLFPDPDSFESFLFFIGEWIVGEILPRKMTPGEEIAELRSIARRLPELTEHILQATGDEFKTEMDDMRERLRRIAEGPEAQLQR